MILLVVISSMDIGSWTSQGGSQVIRIALVFSISLLLTGCDSSQFSTASPSQDAQLSAIRQELDTVKAELAEIKEKQGEYDVDRLVKDFDRIAYLRPGDAGYSTIRYDLGVLTVELADVSSYANGSKVNLKFGNTLSSSVNGLKAKIEWGQTDENGSPDNSSAKSKDVTFNETLNAGAWTTVSVVLDGVPPAELGFVRVRDINHTGILLNK